MVKHIVMWRLKQEAHGNSAEHNARLIKEKLEALSGRIRGLLAIDVGLDFSCTDSSADVVLLSEFTDKAALEAYQRHPEHQALIPFIGGASSERRVVDYEC
ncbi:MAG TPA: Dabb family protein [Chlorobaculum parvum]|uniref:Dabb family protein n=1 Tax=Chlorobaculum parvum TaxID=274539 RepID=A0A7C5DD38_9CHLB|nr:Dabb family protein [Chlorobaculum parvum]